MLLSGGLATIQRWPRRQAPARAKRSAAKGPAAAPPPPTGAATPASFAGARPAASPSAWQARTRGSNGRVPGAAGRPDGRGPQRAAGGARRAPVRVLAAARCSLPPLAVDLCCPFLLPQFAGPPLQPCCSTLGLLGLWSGAAAPRLASQPGTELLHFALPLPSLAGASASSRTKACASTTCAASAPMRCAGAGQLAARERTQARGEPGGIGETSGSGPKQQAAAAAGGRRQLPPQLVPRDEPAVAASEATRREPTRHSTPMPLAHPHAAALLRRATAVWRRSFGAPRTTAATAPASTTTTAASSGRSWMIGPRTATGALPANEVSMLAA